MGTTIEWYDFFIYGTAASLVLGDLFFPSHVPGLSTMQALITYGVGYVARPLGALMFSNLGDRMGRKQSLVLTLLMMGAATFIIGCLPTYETIGIWAPILLIAMRIVQGLAAAGEWGGAALMSIEHAPSGRKTLFGSFVQLGSPCAALLASLAFFLVSKFGPEAFKDWAWRLPFLLSVLLVVIGLWIRFNVEESPEFQKSKATKDLAETPLLEVLRNHHKQILISSGVNFLGIGGIFIVTLYVMLVYAQQLGYSRSLSLSAGVILSLCSIVTFPVWGILGDRFGCRKVAIVGTIYTLIMVFPMFPWCWCELRSQRGNYGLYVSCSCSLQWHLNRLSIFGHTRGRPGSCPVCVDGVQGRRRLLAGCGIPDRNVRYYTRSVACTS
jgi:MFS family permease